MARTYIGDFCDYYKGINIPRSETDVEFDIPYLHYGDIYKLYDFKINLNTKYDKIIKIKKDVKIKPEQYLSDGDIVYTLTSETVDDLGHSTLIINKQNLDFVSGMETTIIRIRDKTNFVPEFINYLFQSDNFRQRLRQYVTGMKVFRVHPRDLMRILIDIPDTQTQQKIVSILDSLTNKIDTNRKINDYLAQFAEMYFEYMIEKCTDYKEMALTDIANYQNGLAMQKYRPIDGESSMPVLKIRELGMGCCDSNSDVCRTNIKNECIVQDGDVVFSWSGSLMIDIWSGGKCGLNQHLFKVTSDEYPLWFVFHWTNHYIGSFKEIAGNKATTMGHICRNHLEESMIICPDNEIFQIMECVLGPVFEERKHLMKEIRVLQKIRDELLPKLMSGEIDV